VLAVSLVGCDPAPTPPETSTDTVATRPATRTTVDVAALRRKDLPLLVVPLVARVPETWGVDQNEGGRMLFLQGPGPTQLVQIHLARRPSLSPTEFDARQAAIKLESERNSNAHSVTVRTLGDLTVVERTDIEKLPSTPVFDDVGNTVTVTSPPFRWKISFYNPPMEKRKDVEVFELNFVGLNVEQYEAEKTFLREIIDSVRYDPSADQPLP